LSLNVVNWKLERIKILPASTLRGVWIVRSMSKPNRRNLEKRKLWKAAHPEGRKEFARAKRKKRNEKRAT